MNKNFHTIANLVLKVIRYILYQAGKTKFINLDNVEDDLIERGCQSDKISIKSSQKIL
jgi:hypothetical protein